MSNLQVFVNEGKYHTYKYQTQLFQLFSLVTNVFKKSSCFSNWKCSGVRRVKVSSPIVLSSTVICMLYFCTHEMLKWKYMFP